MDFEGVVKVYSALNTANEQVNSIVGKIYRRYKMISLETFQQVLHGLVILKKQIQARECILHSSHKFRVPQEFNNIIESYNLEKHAGNVPVSIAIHYLTSISKVVHYESFNSEFYIKIADIIYKHDISAYPIEDLTGMYIFQEY